MSAVIRTRYRTKLDMALDLADRIYRYGEKGQRFSLDHFKLNVVWFEAKPRNELEKLWREQFEMAEGRRGEA